MRAAYDDPSTPLYFPFTALVRSQYFARSHPFVCALFIDDEIIGSTVSSAFRLFVCLFVFPPPFCFSNCSAAPFLSRTNLGGMSDLAADRHDHESKHRPRHMAAKRAPKNKKKIKKKIKERTGRPNGHRDVHNTKNGRERKCGRNAG